MDRYQPPRHHKGGRGSGRGRGRGRGGGILGYPISSATTSDNLTRQHDRDDEERPSTSSSLQQNTNNDQTLPNPTLLGTCPFMCPVEERLQRERLRDLAIFERLDGNPGKTTSSLAVKKFCRTISTKDVQASDLRPLSVLGDTLNYLLHLLDSGGHPFEVIHDFIFDRTRSIRQDLSMQNIIGDEAVLMYERMVKFHIISHHKLQRCTGSSNISPMYHLNLEQLTKALVSLYCLYEENRDSHSIYENEAEFHSFYVLLHLGSDNQPMGETLSVWFRRVPFSIIKSKEMIFSRKLLRYLRFGDYKRFIYTTEAEASCLQYYLVEPYINEVRVFALSCVNYGGYKLHPYPLADLSKQLLMEELDAESLCGDCGLKTSASEAGRKSLLTKQIFCQPKRGFQSHYHLKSERVEKLLLNIVPPSQP